MKRPLTVTICALQCGALGIVTLAFMAPALADQPLGRLNSEYTLFSATTLFLSAAMLVAACGLSRMKDWSRRFAVFCAIGSMVNFIVFAGYEYSRVGLGSWYFMWTWLPLLFPYVLFPLILIYALTRHEIAIAFVTTPAVVEEHMTIVNSVLRNEESA